MVKPLSPLFMNKFLLCTLPASVAIDRSVQAKIEVCAVKLNDKCST